MLIIFIKMEACFEDQGGNQGGDYVSNRRSLIPMRGNPPIRKLQGLSDKRNESRSLIEI